MVCVYLFLFFFHFCRFELTLLFSFLSLLRVLLRVLLLVLVLSGFFCSARLIARYLHAYGVLASNRFINMNALQLKGQYVGQTAPRVIEAVQNAIGGCLFLDEAYALADRGGDAFSDEAVRTLLTEAENNRTDFFCCLAGYEEPMKILMAADPGLPRRFSKQMHLEDYSPCEIALIAKRVAEERFELRVPASLVGLNGEGELAEWIGCRHGHEIHQHNGGLAVNLTEEAFVNLSSRVVREKIMGGDENLLCAADYEIDYGEETEGKRQPKGWKPELNVENTVENIFADCHDLSKRFNVAENQNIFQQAGITDYLLEDLTMELLLEIGVQSMGDRLHIMKVLRKRKIVV